MEKFNREQFDIDGAWVSYDLNNGKNVFIARFKYNKSLQGRFVTFLKNNFTVSEYFNLRETGMSPIAVLRTKDFQI
tara:strand:+ start:450 stop:677 length:228 start_codon:yes stop_codon:yes gene_type:complete